MELDEIPFDTRSPSPVIAEEAPVASTSTALLDDGITPNLYRNPVADAPLSEDVIAARKARAKREARFGRYDSPVVTEAEEEGPPAFALDSAVNLRPNALYLYSSSVNQLDTAAVLNWANANLVDPTSLLGVEWINDASLVLCFNSPSHAIEGVSSLLIHPNDSLSTSLSTALNQLEDFYSEPEAPHLSLVSNYYRARPFPDLPASVYLRFASHRDKKERNAASRSKFYSKLGIRPHEDDRRRTRSDSDRWPSGGDRMERDRKQEELDALDREMDAFAAGDDEPRSGLLSRLSRGSERRRSRSPPRRRSRSPHRRSQADLDDELDAYVNGNDRRRSRSPPRRRSPPPRERRLSTPPKEEPLEVFERQAGGLRAWNDDIQAPVIEVKPESEDATTGYARTEEIKPVKRETAVDLFDASPAKKSKMRGWDD